MFFAQDIFNYIHSDLTQVAGICFMDDCEQQPSPTISCTAATHLAVNV